MEELVRNILFDSDIVNLIGKDTNGNPKIYLIQVPKNTPGSYIEYRILNEIGSLYAENEEIATTYSVQIDIFTQGSYVAIKDAIKKVMKENKFIKEFAGSIENDDSELFHYVLRYNTESEE